MLKKQVKIPDRLLFKVVDARESLLENVGERGYYPSVFAQMSLPGRRPPGSEYTRDVGNGYTMTILCPERVGLPHGIYARGILAYITREVKWRKRHGVDDPKIVTLGKGLGDFLFTLKRKGRPTGGERGSLTMVRRHLHSLVRSNIQFATSADAVLNEDFTNYRFVKSGTHARGPQLWAPDRDEATGDLVIRLDEDFYYDLVGEDGKPGHAMPFTAGVIHALWPNYLMVDIAMWLTYRSNEIECGMKRLSWPSLLRQFGEAYTAPGSDRVFKQRFWKAFEVVRALYDPSDPDAVRLHEVGDALWLTVRRRMVVPSDEAAFDLWARQQRVAKRQTTGPRELTTPWLFGS